MFSPSKVWVLNIYSILECLDIEIIKAPCHREISNLLLSYLLRLGKRVSYSPMKNLHAKQNQSRLLIFNYGYNNILPGLQYCWQEDPLDYNLWAGSRCSTTLLILSKLDSNYPKKVHSLYDWNMYFSEFQRNHLVFFTLNDT